MTLTIKQDYLQGIPYEETLPLEGTEYIIIHNTATVGATAADENVYFHNNWQSIQSFVHAFVDWDGVVYEHAPMGIKVWGAGHVNRFASLQVEQCITTDPVLNRKSAEYTAQYVAKKIKESGKPFEHYTIISHAEASQTFGGTDHMDEIVGMSQVEFVDMVRELTTESDDAQGAEVFPSSKGVFQCGYAIRARGTGPSLKNKHVHTFKQGDRITYDQLLLSEGYLWIRQPRSSGGHWFVPVRSVVTTSDYWGTFTNR